LIIISTCNTDVILTEDGRTFNYENLLLTKKKNISIRLQSNSFPTLLVALLTNYKRQKAPCNKLSSRFYKMGYKGKTSNKKLLTTDKIIKKENAKGK